MLVKILIKIISLSLVLLSLSLKSEEVAAPPQHIISGTWFNIESKVMNESRRYAVHLPPSYADSPDREYPVLYVLDGYETRMRSVGGMIEALSYYDLSQQIPEFIVVAIPSTNRSRELTPTKKDLVFEGQVLDELAENSGGADLFAKFIKDELFATIDGKYRTTQQRGIMGMSFGGLFAAHVLLNQPDMFSHYIISDATFVWDDNYLNRTLSAVKDNLTDKPISVFIGLANNDHLGDVGKANHRWGNDFIASLQKLDNDKLVVKSRYFAEEQHGTVMFLAFYYGLIALFNQA